MKGFLYSIPVFLTDQDRIRAWACDEERLMEIGRLIEQAIEPLSGLTGIDAVHIYQGRSLCASGQVSCVLIPSCLEYTGQQITVEHLESLKACRITTAYTRCRLGSSDPDFRTRYRSPRRIACHGAAGGSGKARALDVAA